MLPVNRMRPGTERRPGDPTEAEIIERAAEVREVGFTSVKGEWFGPWSAETAMIRRDSGLGPRPTVDIGGIREYRTADLEIA